MIKLASGLMLLALLTLSGCGGSTASSLPSPFAGSWTGVSLVFEAESGTALRVPNDLTLTVDPHGAVSGRWNDSHGGGTVTGSVSRTGMLDVVLQNAQDAQDRVAASGGTTLGPNGRWQGSLAVTSPAVAGLQLVWAVQPEATPGAGAP